MVGGAVFFGAIFGLVWRRSRSDDVSSKLSISPQSSINETRTEGKVGHYQEIPALYQGKNKGKKEMQPRGM